MSRGRVEFRAPFRDCAVWWCDTLHVTAPQVRAMQRALIATLRGILLDCTAYAQYDLSGKSLPSVARFVCASLYYDVRYG